MTKKSVYQRYKDSVNMTYSQLLAWSQTECSRKASLDRSPIKRNLRLLSKNKSEWTALDERDAKRTISFVARMRANKRGRPVCNGLSKRDISLRNWAYDPLALKKPF